VLLLQSNCRAWRDVCVYHMFEYVTEIGTIAVLMLGNVLIKYGTLATYLGEVLSFTSFVDLRHFCFAKFYSPSLGWEQNFLHESIQDHLKILLPTYLNSDKCSSYQNTPVLFRCRWHEVVNTHRLKLLSSKPSWSMSPSVLWFKATLLDE
jgi:hypothetical protein